MSSSDQQETREDEVKAMDSMCSMVKGKQTYLGLTRRQWIDRFLDWDPATSIEDLANGDFHIVELAKSCEMDDDDDDDLVSVDSEDEETEHEYKGKMYKGKELLDLWESEADQAKQEYKEYEKSSAKKQKTEKPKSGKTDKSNGAGAKGAKAKTGTAWSRFLIGDRTHGSRPVGLQEVLRERGQGLGGSGHVHRSGWNVALQGPRRRQVR
jgi:hypothetical protein